MFRESEGLMIFLFHRGHDGSCPSFKPRAPGPEVEEFIGMGRLKALSDGGSELPAWGSAGHHDPRNDCLTTRIWGSSTAKST